MTDAATIKAREVRIGDRLRMPSGGELTVDRIDENFFGRPDFVAFVEDSADQWLKLPMPREAEVELVSRSG